MSSTIITQGGAVISGTLTASAPSTNHITTIRPLACALHHSFFTSSDLFKQVQNELAFLLVAHDTTKENLEGTKSSDTLLSELDRELQNCHWTLLDLQNFKEHFENVWPDTQVTWEREEWRTEELGEIRARLSSYTGILNLLSIYMIRSSQAHVEQLSKVFIDEIHSGRREGSVVSNDSLSMNGREAWKQLRKELEGVGVSPEAFTQSRYFILTTLKKAILEEGLRGDININIQDMDDLEETMDGFQTRPRKTGDRIFSSILPAWITTLTRIANMLYKAIGYENDLICCATNGDLDLVKLRLAEGEDVKIRNDARETLIFQAAAYRHDDVVRLLLAHGADVDVKDFWHNMPLHKAAEKSHTKTAQIFLKNGTKNDGKASGKAGMETFDVLLNWE